jgi:hypothetical protein
MIRKKFNWLPPALAFYVKCRCSGHAVTLRRDGNWLLTGTWWMVTDREGEVPDWWVGGVDAWHRRGIELEKENDDEIQEETSCD